MSTPALRRAALATHPDHPVETRVGFEIVYVPALSGWQIHGDGAPVSGESYRSAFLARKAADELSASTA